MAGPISIPTDSAGNLGVSCNMPTGTNATQTQGITSTGSTLTGNVVPLGAPADGANGAAQKVQPCNLDQANSLKVNPEGQKTTYSYAFQVTPAASATDIAGIVGSATKLVKITKMRISGVANTAVVIDVLLIKRSAADTGGTSTNPGAVNHDSNDAAATATAYNYSANPSVGATGAKYGTFEEDKLTIGKSDGTTKPDVLVWDFAQRSEKALTLRGTADAVYLNLNGVQSAGEVLNVDITTTEE